MNWKKLGAALSLGAGLVQAAGPAIAQESADSGAISSASTQREGGGVREAGNGGDAVVCFQTIEEAERVAKILRDKNRKKDVDALYGVDINSLQVTMLDVWATKRGIGATLQEAYVKPAQGITPQELVNQQLARFSEKTAYGIILQQEIKRDADGIRWEPRSAGVIEINDSNHAWRFPPNCLLVQVAVNKEFEISYDERLVGRMDTLSQAALILHENVYSVARRHYHRESSASRALTSFILSRQLDQKSGLEINEMILKDLKLAQTAPFNSALYEPGTDPAIKEFMDLNRYKLSTLQLSSQSPLYSRMPYQEGGLQEPIWIAIPDSRFSTNSTYFEKREQMEVMPWSDIVVDGIPLAGVEKKISYNYRKGSHVFRYSDMVVCTASFKNGTVINGTLSRDFEYGGLTFAKDSCISFSVNRKVLFATLAKSTLIQGYKVKADKVDFHENGKLKEAHLEEGQKILGLSVHGDASVRFWDNGSPAHFTTVWEWQKLKGLTLKQGAQVYVATNQRYAAAELSSEITCKNAKGEWMSVFDRERACIDLKGKDYVQGSKTCPIVDKKLCFQ